MWACSYGMRFNKKDKDSNYIENSHAFKENPNNFTLKFKSYPIPKAFANMFITQNEDVRQTEEKLT